jgi:hypothetical protein
MGLSYYDNAYRFEGKVYCETDLSEELGDEYGGDLYDLYWELSHNRKILDEKTLYYKRDVEEGERIYYDSPEELLADMVEELGLEVLEEH